MAKSALITGTLVPRFPRTRAHSFDAAGVAVWRL